MVNILWDVKENMNDIIMKVEFIVKLLPTMAPLCIAIHNNMMPIIYQNKPDKKHKNPKTSLMLKSTK